MQVARRRLDDDRVARRHPASLERPPTRSRGAVRNRLGVGSGRAPLVVPASTRNLRDEERRAGGGVRPSSTASRRRLALAAAHRTTTAQPATRHSMVTSILIPAGLLHRPDDLTVTDDF